MTNMPAYVPSRSLPARLVRRITQWNAVQPIGKTPTKPIVSFTFDDFPKSAADIGAQIVESGGGRATYYACTSFEGSRTTTGDQFDQSDIEALQNAGHEIGAHTHTHLDCAKSSVESAREDIRQNLSRLADLGALDIQNFAYPYGETQLALKRALIGKFQTARGVLAGQNTGHSDRMQLRAFELAEDSWTTDRAKNALAAAAEKPSWVVFFTHGVTRSAESYGTTPKDLRELVIMAQDIGADILTIKAAMQRLSANDND